MPETCRKRPRLARECAKAHSFSREDGAMDSENANKSKKKKTSNIIQICIGVLAVVLAVSVTNNMSDFLHCISITILFYICKT